MQLTPREWSVLADMLRRVRPASAVMVSFKVFGDTPSAFSVLDGQEVLGWKILQQLEGMKLVTGAVTDKHPAPYGQFWMTPLQRGIARELLGIEEADGPQVVRLTASGQTALRVLFRLDRPLMAWEVGKEGFRHIAVTDGRESNPRNHRTLAAASALKTLCAGRYATRLSEKTYGLSPSQRTYVREHFPHWKSRGDLPVKICPEVVAPYRAALGPVELTVLGAALRVYKHGEAFTSDQVLCDLVDHGQAGCVGVNITVCHFMLERLAVAGALKIMRGGWFLFDDDQLPLARCAFASEGGPLPAPEVVLSARQGRAVELD